MSLHNTVSDRGLLRGALGLAFVSLLVFGGLYTLLGVGLGQALFPSAANGSLIERGGRVVGSSLVAQPFGDARYFQSRPSAAGHDPMAASGSNQARTHPELRERIARARAAVASREGVDPAAVPGELVTASGSGLDPHIGPAAAAIQVARVARARGLTPEAVQALVDRHTEPRQFGLLGEPRINVLELNLALDARVP
jgi:K+-transporting ATPase ATPase C chain